MHWILIQWVLITVIIVVYVFVLYKRDRHDFWKVVSKHPDDAFEMFQQQDCWRVFMEKPEGGYSSELPYGQWDGPFKLSVPKLGHRLITIYGKVPDYEKAQQQFMDNIKGIHQVETQKEPGNRYPNVRKMEIAVDPYLHSKMHKVPPTPVPRSAETAIQKRTEETTPEVPLEEIEEDVNLDSSDSGSGLRDLSLLADDTSLGDILDEIYIAEGEGNELGEAEGDSSMATTSLNPWATQYSDLKLQQFTLACGTLFLLLGGSGVIVFYSSYICGVPEHISVSLDEVQHIISAEPAGNTVYKEMAEILLYVAILGLILIGLATLMVVLTNKRQNQIQNNKPR